MRCILSFFCIIITITLACGCCYLIAGNEKITREYLHNYSNNVTINFFPPWENLTVTETNSTQIKIIESFYLKTYYVKNNNSVIDNYVKFNGNETFLSINISVISLVDSFNTRDANTSVIVYLPKNINYTINYVKSYDLIHG
jgi:hypothetical protein